MEDSKLDKVIKTLEYCTTSEDCRPCEYWQTFDDTGCQCMKDALELLKDYKQHLQHDLETLEERKRELEFEHELKAFVYKEELGRLVK